MQIQHFYDQPTGSLTYLVDDGHRGVVIDPIRDYDPRSGRVSWASSENVARVIRERGLQIDYVIDTHAHADHMTGLPYFKEHFGAQTVTGRGVGAIQSTFRDFYNIGPELDVDGSQFDLLADDDQVLGCGELEFRAMHTPGHTPSHLAWQIEDVVFVGDTLFMPDFGTARCDFPGGAAATLYDSIQRLYRLPDITRLLTGHDYQPGGRALAFESTVGEQKRNNVQLNARTTRDEYVAFRTSRDSDLAAPNLLLPAMQVNIRAGELPEAEDNGVRYLRIPLNALGAAREETDDAEVAPEHDTSATVERLRRTAAFA